MQNFVIIFCLLAAGLTAAQGQNFACNFDRNNFCQWTNVRGTDSKDWSLNRGSTTSSGTGPSSDHTSGSGYYAYLETNSGSQGSKAQLQSPSFAINRGQTKCLSLYYHMYGPNVGYLNVYLKKNGVLGQPIWRRNGNKGNQWKMGSINIQSTSNVRTAQIVIEATKGNGPRGDISIDDIQVTNGQCGQGQTTLSPGATPSPSSVTCDFEASNLCEWKNDQTDNFNWIWKSGSTSTSNTGPTNDHTTNTATGHYVYIEANGHRQGAKARLIAPSYSGRSSTCFQFYYNMHGQQIGTLSVYKKTSRGLGSPIWSLSGDQGTGWQFGQVSIRSGTAYSVVFEALRGSGNKGDIAVDDPKMFTGSCPKRGFCNFDKDFCGWTNSVTDQFDWIRNKGATSSTGTGPTNDHTQGSRGTGYYIYIEASSPRARGDTAQIVSEVFPPSSQSYCIQFWYNMNGNSIGSLTVYAVTGGVQTPLWQLSGQQSGQWNFGKVSVLSPNSTFQFIIEGMRGNGILGDIAIDDVSVTQSRCARQPSSARPISQTTTTTPVTTTVRTSTGRTTAAANPQSSVTCNFDGGLCGWTQVRSPTDDFDWTRKQGSTASVGTGPTQDHTSGKGYYVYIEASSRRQNESAQIRSPQISPSTGSNTLCLTFWYSMFGANIGALNLYTQTQAILGNPVWKRRGNQGNQWRQAQVTVSLAVPFNFVFEGKVGNSYRGDIALDDVKLTNGPCSGSGPVRNCGFESSSICGYTQDATDQFNWTWKSGSTGTANTGPSNDHTYGTSQGHYVYIETSSPRRPNDIARILSPRFQDNTDMCMQFYYHMLGDGVGTLNVYAQVNTNRGNALFTLSGNQGNTWHQGQMSIPQVTTSQGYKVVFEGIRGTNLRGDIAIDDVSFSKGACRSGTCDFETDLCSWSNVAGGDDFDWIRNQGVTITSNTGPMGDHTLGSASGHYVYIETSAPRQAGDIAWLVSSTRPATSSGCINFWYNMKGQTIDTLTVYMKIPGGGNQTLWTLKGNQGLQWQNGQVPLSSTQNFQIVFEGRRGQSYTGDIALDDITFSNQNCGLQPASAAPPAVTGTTPMTTTVAPNNGPFNCQFTTGFCGWTQSTTDDFNWSRNRGSTLTSGTGPPGDHTGGGYYIYTEASAPAKPGHKAQLISPNVQPGGQGQMCLTFWYFMYGRNVDNLNVYVQAGLVLPSQPVWKRSGTQGLQWQMATVNIRSRSVFNVVIEGTRGAGYLGDIAVDDISIANGTCSQGTTPSPTTGLSSCTFEDSTYCGFTQDTTDGFNWRQGSGRTAATNTGPTNDHTYKTAAGHYMFTQGSSQPSGRKARLISPIYLANTQPVCVKFWYNMYGTGIGTLNIYKKASGVLGSPIWSLSGSQSRDWREASVTIPAGSAYRVVFEVVNGNRQGDIAIDDYTQTPGSCGVRGNCNFDKGFCTWTNDHAYDRFDWTLGHGSTVSTNTGPTNDHTQGNSNGQYVYIESSSPRHPGDVATLNSEMLSYTGHQCMNFWYHMYGANIGTLRIWILPNGTVNPIPLWELQNAQGNQWKQGSIALPKQTGTFMILVKGTVGSGFLGDIAVDDITFTSTAGCSRMPANAVPTVTQKPTVVTTTPTTTTASTTTSTTAATTAKPTGGNSFACDFTYDSCGWVQDKSDNFDWTRKSGTTTSVQTGPTGDHTTGTGYYYYVEASAPQTVGMKARFISPVVQIASGTQKCFSFYYSMYGDQVDYLNVYVKKNGALGSAVWTRNGNQGSQWVQGQVTITGPGPLNVVIEGTKGTGYRGDIGIDDVNITTGACSGQNLNTTANPLTATTIAQLSCNFESQSICNYHQSTTGLQWKWQHGGTPSANTGPSSDHTTGTATGHYMYIEASGVSNQVAQLSSLQETQTGAACIQFWFHMYGNNIGTLNVYTAQGGQNGSPVWSRQRNQGNRWNLAQISINPSSPYSLVFEAKHRTGIQGDIAIDDIVAQPGRCGDPGSCNFDGRNFCTWQNLKTDDFDWSVHGGGTPSTGTGPSSDHTLQNSKGLYAYIETSAPRRRGQKAQLLSASQAPTGISGKCFKFWYHMYGRTVGTLNVYVSKNVSSSNLLWTLSGNQGNQWKPAQLSVTSTQSFNLIIEGIVGGSIYGDIAIDDLSFSNGACGLSPSNAYPSTATTTTVASTTTRVVTATSTVGTFNCNFESNLCGWNQDKRDTFDWTRHKGATVSASTGPPSDHTTGNGYYVYIEASAPRQPNDTAQLISPPVSASSNPRCLTFWYFMYGAHVNSLNIYIPVGANLGSPIWTRKGTQGNQWNQAQVTITKNKQFNVIFSGVRGNGVFGDIAVDDISLAPGACGGATAAPGSGPTNCTFEDVYICNYIQDLTDNFNWTRQSGSTSSSNTGPSSDHTYGTSAGHYMYIEASSPARPGQLARLFTPKYPAVNQDQCLQFYYHMYGSQIGKLNVKLRLNNALGSTIWSKSGNQGNQWSIAQVTLQNIQINTPTYQVAFEGVRGTGFLSDIAIDDVSIVNGTCQSPGSCDFEKGRCTWTEAQSGDDFDWKQGSGRTTSTGTGPSNDHTLQSSTGHYLYLEASSPRRQGDRCWLVSPRFSATTNTCFQFWYSMSGQGIGSLSVIVKYPDAGTNTTVWSLSGDQGNRWIQGQVPITASRNYQVVIEGLRGSSFAGDIAIDDVSFSSSKCGISPSSASPSTSGGSNVTTTPLTTVASTQPVQGQLNCDFSSGPCLWTQDKSDQFDWTRKSGATATVNTGPPSDHTQQSSGKKSLDNPQLATTTTLRPLHPVVLGTRPVLSAPRSP
ncbi:MAM and LDL-receptor class A domain-containing protein 1-like [Crassostrea virginica]